ncbi:MAG TPA: YkgJ family cysteine cluster protein [Bacteroidia bacterium]|nr:YkgJ family cysteine cluster protein [Bacteroidia bacterium]
MYSLTIPEKVNAVEIIFQELSDEIKKFQNSSGLSCLKGCSNCCKKPDIEATILEFLPLAYHLYQTEKAYEALEKLKENADNSICMLYTTNKIGVFGSGCSDYNYRGLICRLFGFSASSDKNGIPRLSTCKIIKENQQSEYVKVVEDLKNGAFIPIISEYYMKLSSIDMNLTKNFYPINEAMQQAIETVLTFYEYSKLDVGN